MHRLICVRKGLMGNLKNNINYANLTDEEIVNLAQLGDKSATEYIVGKYKELVEIRSAPYFMAGGDREDLIQEGLLGLYKAVKTYDSNRRANFKTFAEICVVRQMISAVKSATRKKNIPLNHYVSIHTSNDETDAIAIKLVDSKNQNPENIVIEKESAKGMESKINSVLSDFESQVLDYYLLGISYREIAQIIGKTPKAVDNALFRIKKKIEKYI